MSTATFVPRIVVTGSECTGKTTLARLLAEQLRGLWVPEFSRTYAESAPGPLTAADVPEIARGQIALENASLAASPTLIVQDTDLVSTVVYARHYYGACPEWILTETRDRLASLYLLCDIDIPWQGDGVRDRPFEREVLDSLFRATLAEFNATVAPVSGIGDTRLRNALDAHRAWSNSR